MASHFITINNLPPTLTVSSSGEATEGASFRLTVSADDPGRDWDTLERITIDWGDGTTSEYLHTEVWMDYKFYHVYQDDNPTSTPSDNYTITVTIEDDDQGVATTTHNIVVKNADPTVTITEITAIDPDTLDSDGIPVAIGTLYEGGTFRVRGVVHDPGGLDVLTTTLKVDTNFDGDTDDEGESFEWDLANGSEFSATFTIPDDGPFGTWGNETSEDLITVFASVTDDDTGSGSTTGQIKVHNADPVFANEPKIEFEFDGDWNAISASVVGAFFDIGAFDYHDVIVTWGDGQPTTNRYAPGETDFDVVRSIIPGMGTSFLYPVIVKVIDDDTGSVEKQVDESCSCACGNEATSQLVGSTQQLFDGDQFISQSSQLNVLQFSHTATESNLYPWGFDPLKWNMKFNQPMGLHYQKIHTEVYLLDKTGNVIYWAKLDAVDLTDGEDEIIDVHTSTNIKQFVMSHAKDPEKGVCSIQYRRNATFRVVDTVLVDPVGPESPRPYDPSIDFQGMVHGHYWDSEGRNSYGWGSPRNGIITEGKLFEAITSPAAIEYFRMDYHIKADTSIRRNWVLPGGTANVRGSYEFNFIGKDQFSNTEGQFERRILFE